MFPLTPFVITLAAITATSTGLIQSQPGDFVSWTPSEAAFKLYKELQWRSTFTRNATLDDKGLARKMKELMAWTPPDYIVKNFPYYFAGYSYEGHPVWIVEGGKFDINDLIRQGPQMIHAIEDAAEQALLRVLKSMDDARIGDELPGAEGIVDLDGMNVNKFSDPQAIALAFKIAHRYIGVGLLGLRSAVVVNSNYFVETMLNIFRPVLGQLMERVEIYGSNPRKWIPRLRELYPASTLPPWYGGEKDFKPLAVYG